MNDIQKDLLIELLKQKPDLTELEKDILDTWKESKKFSLGDSAKIRIAMNNGKYKDVIEKVNALPTTVIKKEEQITENDLRYILSMQLIFLCEKELGENTDGKNENGIV